MLPSNKACVPGAKHHVPDEERWESEFLSVYNYAIMQASSAALIIVWKNTTDSLPGRHTSLTGARSDAGSM